VDEHRKMCDRVINSEGGAAFFRGAMQALSYVSRAKVVATYVDPPDLPAVASSGVCRKPVALPLLDLELIMAKVPELYIDSSSFDVVERRLLATLKFRLGFKVRQLGHIGLLHVRRSGSKADVFLTNFQNTISTGLKSKSIAMKKAIKDCIALCDVSFDLAMVEDLDAIKLLLSLDDETLEALASKRQITNIVVLPNSYVSTSITNLLKIRDPRNPVFETGQELFWNSIAETDTDIMSGTPLESAYYWTLSCTSAATGSIRFNSAKKFTIKCEDLVPGRLFQGTNSSDYDVSFLQKSKIYFAREKIDSIPSHPLADLFFLSDKNELVLVDISGGNLEGAIVKLKKLTDWIKREEAKIKDNANISAIYGIVLAPNVNNNQVTNKHGNDVSDLIYGTVAVKLLGGLSQTLQWFE
jgi:hypothetical protein